MQTQACKGHQNLWKRGSGAEVCKLGSTVFCNESKKEQEDNIPAMNKEPNYC